MPNDDRIPLLPRLAILLLREGLPPSERAAFEVLAVELVGVLPAWRLPLALLRLARHLARGSGLPLTGSAGAPRRPDAAVRGR